MQYHSFILFCSFFAYSLLSNDISAFNLNKNLALGLRTRRDYLTTKIFSFTLVIVFVCVSGLFYDFLFRLISGSRKHNESSHTFRQRREMHAFHEMSTTRPRHFKGENVLLFVSVVVIKI